MSAARSSPTIVINLRDLWLSAATFSLHYLPRCLRSVVTSYMRQTPYYGDSKQRCTGAGVWEWTPAGVLTIFENGSGAGVDFSKEGPEWSWSHFFNKRLVCLLLNNIIADCFFTKHVTT